MTDAQISSAYSQILDVIGSVEPRIAEATRQELVDQRASRVGDIPAVVNDGVTGLLVEPGDPVALATALVQLLRDPDLAERLGDAGERLLTAGSSWDEVAAAVDAVWGER